MNMNLEIPNFSNPITCLASLDCSKALRVTVTDAEILEVLATCDTTDLSRREAIVLKALPLIQTFSSRYIPQRNLPQFNNGDTLIVTMPVQDFADWLKLSV